MVGIGYGLYDAIKQLVVNELTEWPGDSDEASEE